MGTSTKLTAWAAAAILTGMIGCSKQEFSGQVGKKAGAPQEQPTPKKTPEEKPKPETPVTQVPNEELPPVETSDDETTLPGDTGDTTDQAGNEPDTDIVDIVGGLLKILTEVEVDRPNDNEIVFGGDKVFHIGDAEFSPSSECARRIRAYPLKGTKYFFEFEVIEDDTKVEVEINKICGVDYNNSNSVSFSDQGGSALAQQPLQKGQGSAQFASQTLKKGKYSIVVESKAAGEENPSRPDDHDDYIVGNVKIRADKPVKPGQVGAQ